MKHITKILQIMLGMVALVVTAIIAIGRLTWRTIKGWWGRLAKWLQWLIATPLIIAPTVFTIWLIYGWYDHEFGRYSDWYNETLSDNVEVHSFRDDTYRVYNTLTRRYTTDKVNWVSEAPEHDSLAVYAIPHKRGYINIKNGEIVIDAESNTYRKAWVFSEGLAAVMQDNKVGFINSLGEIVIPFQFDYSDKVCSWQFGYVFHDGYCVMTNNTGQMGLIDTLGRWVIEPLYDEIWAPTESGHRVIINDGMFGVLGPNCQELYPTEYDCIDIMSDGFVLARGGRMWQVDFDGKVTNPFMFQDTCHLGYPSGYDDCGDVVYTFASYIKYEIMNRYGIMDINTGRPITPAIYADIRMLSCDVLEVQHPDSYEWSTFSSRTNAIP